MLLNKITFTTTALILAGLASAYVVRSQGTEEPTKVHKEMLKGVGEWQGTMTMLAEGQEMEMAATETVKAVGEFWTVSDFRVEMGPDMTYHGHGTMGYDPKAKEVVGTWVDNMTSYMSVMRGEFDLETGEQELHWEAPVAEMGGQMAKHRMSTKFTENHYTMTMSVKAGEEYMDIFRVDMDKKGAKSGDAKK